jgi:hypothetical protein
MLNLIEKNCMNIISISKKIWKGKIKFSYVNLRNLIRKNMHPAIEDSNACLAFRPRDKEKMKLRRNYRFND